MNERIKELAEQAGGEFYEGFAGSTNFVKFAENNFEKFAELIVRECAELFVDQKYMILNPHEPFANERVRALKEHDKDTVKKIKKHFGVDSAGKALAQPEQEPVAWQPLPCPFCGHIGLDFADGETYRWGVASCGGCGASCGDVRREYPDKGEWHTEAIAEWNKQSPTPQRKPLTDEDVERIVREARVGEHGIGYTIARAIEAAHDIKE